LAAGVLGLCFAGLASAAEEAVQAPAPFDAKSCLKAPETGMCRAHLTRWAFNKENGKCRMFVYGGCGGNQNNFEFKEECMEKCAGVKGAKRQHAGAPHHQEGAMEQWSEEKLQEWREAHPGELDKAANGNGIVHHRAPVKVEEGEEEEEEEEDGDGEEDDDEDDEDEDDEDDDDDADDEDEDDEEDEPKKGNSKRLLLVDGGEEEEEALLVIHPVERTLLADVVKHDSGVALEDGDGAKEDEEGEEEEEEEEDGAVEEAEKEEDEVEEEEEEEEDDEDEEDLDDDDGTGTKEEPVEARRRRHSRRIML